MMPDMIHEAFGAEARQLSRVLAGLDDAAFARPTACTPWIVAELVPRAQIPAVAVAPSR
jgi:Mycothiol maleylpyruvate isomerase N-terminal domain